MNFFKKRKHTSPSAAPQPVFPADLPKAGEDLPASLKAYSHFIKRVNCSQCGALLSFPVSAGHLACPYCQTDNRRV